MQKNARVIYNSKNSIDKYVYSRSSKRANFPCTQIANVIENVNLIINIFIYVCLEISQWVHKRFLKFI